MFLDQDPQSQESLQDTPNWGQALLPGAVGVGFSTEVIYSIWRKVSNQRLERRQRVEKESGISSGWKRCLVTEYLSNYSVNWGFTSTKPEVIVERQTKTVSVSFICLCWVITKHVLWVMRQLSSSEREKLEFRRWRVVLFFCLVRKNILLLILKAKRACKISPSWNYRSCQTVGIRRLAD